MTRLNLKIVLGTTDQKPSSLSEKQQFSSIAIKTPIDQTWPPAPYSTDFYP
jgi:hypothetical protein